MLVEHQVPLQALNTFHIVARAQRLVRIHSEADVLAVLADPQLRQASKFVLGGGSNLVITGDVQPLVLKSEIGGCRVVEQRAKVTVVEAGAGVDWQRTTSLDRSTLPSTPS